MTAHQMLVMLINSYENVERDDELFLISCKATGWSDEDAKKALEIVKENLS